MLFALYTRIGLFQIQTLLLTPICPHLAEHLWELMGKVSVNSVIPPSPGEVSMKGLWEEWTSPPLFYVALWSATSFVEALRILKFSRPPLQTS